MYNLCKYMYKACAYFGRYFVPIKETKPLTNVHFKPFSSLNIPVFIPKYLYCFIQGIF